MIPKKLVLWTALAVAASSLLFSCSDEPYLISKEEEYTREFVKTIGLVGSEQDWNMAKKAEVTVDLGATERKSVKVYAKYDGVYYLVAKMAGVSGRLTVPVDVPKVSDDVMVRVNYRSDFFGHLGQTIDCTGKGRASHVDMEAGEFVYDPEDPTFDFGTNMTKYGNEEFRINVSRSEADAETIEKGYWYFNARQVGPIVSQNFVDGWHDYVSMETHNYYKNNNKRLSILPEISKENQTDGNTRNLSAFYTDADVAAAIKYAQQASELRQDFTYTSSTGEFNVYPAFYGSNQVHILGIYFIDPYTGEPLYGKDNDGDGKPDLIKFPIYENKHGDDIQLKLEEGSLNDIAECKVGDVHFAKEDANGYYPSYEVQMEVGDIVELPITAVTYGGETLTGYNIVSKLYVADTYSNCADVYKSDDESKICIKANSTTTDYWPKLVLNDGTDRKISLKIVISDPAPEDDGCYFTMQDPTQEGRILKALPGGDGDIKYFSGTLNMKLGEVATFQLKFYDQDENLVEDAATAMSKLSVETYLSQDRCKIELNESEGTVIVTATGLINEEIYFPKLKYYNGRRIGMKITVTEDGSGIPESQAENTRRRSEQALDDKESSDEYRAAVSEGGLLYHDANTQWVDINKVYTGGTDGTVNSFSVEDQRLVRSRGYHVKLTYQGRPWTGPFGMYIDYKWNPEEAEDMSITTGERPISGSHYSQMALNNGDPALNKYVYRDGGKLAADYKAKWAEHGIPETAVFEYSYAATFLHPVSGYRYFSFEDWPVLHPGPNDWDTTHKYHGWAYEGQFNWDTGAGTYSSDRDNNDLIFLITGIDDVQGDDDISWDEDEVIVNEKGFTWIWAVEDLGATDDFDFNDLVMRITSVTEITRVDKTTTHVTDSDGNETTTEESKETVLKSKKVTFQPLAAGGTLPLYVHWTHKDTTYCLQPGAYYEGKRRPAEIDQDIEHRTLTPLSTLVGNTVGWEIHRWFDELDYTKMINTQQQGPVGHRCIIYLDEDFTIEGFGESNQSIDAHGNKAGLSVYVDDERELQTGQIEKGWTVAAPEKGKVSQMFIIYAPDGVWRWPAERRAIHQCYPAFETWLQDASTEWFKAPGNGAPTLSNSAE